MLSHKVCNCSINCQRARKSNVCARLLNTSSYSTDTVALKERVNAWMRLNLVKHGCIPHMKLRLSLAAYWQGSLLRLRLSPSGSTSSHGSSLTRVASSLCSSGYNEGLPEKSDLTLNAIELPRPKWRHVASVART